MEGKGSLKRFSKNHFTDKQLKKPITCFVILEENIVMIIIYHSRKVI